MVLESLISGISAERRPGMLIVFGFALSSISLLLSMVIFKDQASVVFLFLTVMGAIPVMYNVIKLEEKKDVSDFHEVALLKEHWKALKAFLALFLGITLAVTFWFIILPGGINNELFETQIQTFNGIQIHGGTVGEATGSLQVFSTIFFNNIKVLIFCVIFSFLYGAGAIFILTWNASIIGVAIGNYIRSGIASVSHLFGLNKISEYFGTITFGLFRYVIHGIPEILAYFAAALAGGIVSVAVIKHDFKGRKFEHIVLDAADLLLLSLALTFIAAILEVWVTPLIF